MNDDRTFKQVQKENEKLRSRIDTLICEFGMLKVKNSLWELINELIENELEQEKRCGE